MGCAGGNDHDKQQERPLGEGPEKEREGEGCQAQKDACPVSDPHPVPGSALLADFVQHTGAREGPESLRAGAGGLQGAI